MVHFRPRSGAAVCPGLPAQRAKDILPKIYLLVPLIVLVYAIIVEATMSRGAMPPSPLSPWVDWCRTGKGKKLSWPCPHPLAVIVILGSVLRMDPGGPG